MVLAANKADTVEQARQMLEKTIQDGSALAKLSQFITAQGGDGDMVYHPEKLPKADMIEEILSPLTGYVEHIECDEIGICSLILGGGRETKESDIDLSVGIVLHKKVGDAVKEGESLATIHANDKQKLEMAKERFIKAYTISTSEVAKKPFIKGVVTK